MTEFKVGDKVATDLFDATHGVVVYGPYPMASITAPVVLVELSDGPRSGACVTVTVHSAKPYTKAYQRGQLVSLTNSIDQYVVERGPFKNLSGCFYVVENLSTGLFSVAQSTNLRPAADPKPARTYEYDGVTYDLDAEYYDIEGDVWRFTGETNRDGTPEFVTSESSTRTLAKAVYIWGPLKRV